MDKELPISPWPEWKIISKIGEGSFGRVYKAQRTEKGRSFYSAIKIITIPASKGELDSVRSESGDEKSVRDYFENLVEECIQEVSTMEYFRGNSHIVSVEDYKVMEYLDEIGWDIFIRMEYLTSFMEYYAGKNLTEKEVMKLGIDLCKALEYCGQLHIIHRDIKPENIFVSRFGDFKLGDFGIARELEKTMSTLSKKGTYSYMAPEMYRGEKYDSSVDIYALGLVLYKLMNHNRLPFLNLEKQLITYRDKENALTRRMSGETPSAPADAGAEFGRVILKACAYDARERYQTPEEFRKELEALRSGEKIPGHTDTRTMPSAMPKFLQEGAAQQLSRTSQLNIEAVRQARRDSVHPEKQPVQRTTVQTVQNAGAGNAGNAGSGGAVSGLQSSQQKSGAKSKVPGSRPVSQQQPGRSQHRNPGIPKTGVVQPRVTRISEMEDQGQNNRDQDLREWKDPISESTGNNTLKNGRRPFSWKAKRAALAAVPICVILAAVLILKPAGGQKANYVDNDGDMLDASNFGTTDDSDKSLTEALSTIRDHATTIANALDSYKREGTEGECLRYYNESGKIAKVLVYPADSADGVYEEYYYWDEQMFFTYVWSGDEKQYFYYQDGLLIRWIDEDGKVHDKESDNDEYVELGDKYWSNSVVELQQ